MFGNREFLEDSDSSFELDGPETPPPEFETYNQYSSNPNYDPEFDFEDKPSLHNLQSIPKEEFNTAPTGNFVPMRKEKPEKVAVVKEDPVRPPSASAQMRAKMLEQQRSKLLSRGQASATIQSNNFLQSDNTPLSNFLVSDKILNGKDLEESKQFKDFRTGGGFEPKMQGVTEDKLPGPIKADRTVFKNVEDELEEMTLDEATAVRNNPSKALQEARETPSQQSVPQETYKDTQYQQVPPKQPLPDQMPPQQIPLQQVPPQQVPPQQAPPQQMPPHQYHDQRSQPVEQTLQPQPVHRAPEEQTSDTHQGNQALSPVQPVRPQNDIPRNPQTNIREILEREMTDMKRFLTSPLPRGIMVQCTIKRDKKGFGRLFPKYYMHLSDGWTFLLAGKKRGANRTSNYAITMNQKDFSVKNPSYLGKVRSNFLGTEFHIFDNGLNPKRKGANSSNMREELGIVLYQSNILGAKGPRKMKVLLPAVNASGDHYIWRPPNKNEGMIPSFKAGNKEGILSFINKSPKWNENVQAFVLNFNGRVDMASVKNFQLIDERDDTKVYLQFGKTGKHDFNLDFQWPFSPVQAFGIAMTSFDYKFACE